MRPVLAALAVLMVLPAAKASAAQGSSCAHPATWHVGPDEVRHDMYPEDPNGGPIEGELRSLPGAPLRHGPVRLALVPNNGSNPYAEASAARPWRICSVRGAYTGGGTWLMPGTTGAGGKPSFVTRRFMTEGDGRARTIVVSYARRSRADGRSCANPRVVIASRVREGEGDPGARLRALETFDGSGVGTMTAQWQAAKGSHVCRVGGGDTRGGPWTVSGGGDGSHRMHHSVTGSHEDTILYLWMAFRR